MLCVNNAGAINESESRTAGYLPSNEISPVQRYPTTAGALSSHPRRLSS